MAAYRERRLSGVKKAAILFMALGPSLSARVLKYFNEEEIEKITTEIANTPRVDKESLEEVIEEFTLINEAREYILNGGVSYARELLEHTLGPQKAAEMMRKLKESSKVKPFTFARKADIRQLVNMVTQEHPQTIAFILSHLDPDQAAMVLSELSPESRSDIARRIAVMERTSPEVVKNVERVMQERLSSVLQQGFNSAGGLPVIVDILNHVDRSTEKLILEDMEKMDAELAEKIRQQMFLFEDIVTLDNASIQRVLRELDYDSIALALKGSSDEVKSRIFKNISKRAGELLRETMEYMGPVRLKDVEQAQQKIVEVIRRLDESGEIVISRGGEDALVV